MKKIALLAFALIFGAYVSVRAQVVPTIDQPVDVRGLGMGNSGLALPGSANSIFANTAALALNSNTWGAGYTFGFWSPYTGVWAPPEGSAKENRHSLAGYYKFGRHAVAAGVRYYLKPAWGSNEVGGAVENINTHDMMGDLGYAFAINQYIGISANVRYINSKLTDSKDMQNGQSVAADLGFYFRRKGLSAALTVANFGSKMRFSKDGPKEDPGSWIKAGVGYAWPIADEHVLTGTLQLGYQVIPSKGALDGGVGLEYMYDNAIAARVGYHLAGNKGPKYTSVGLGVRLGGFSLNGAYLIGGLLKNTLVLSLEANF